MVSMTSFMNAVAQIRLLNLKLFFRVCDSLRMPSKRGSLLMYQPRAYSGHKYSVTSVSLSQLDGYSGKSGTLRKAYASEASKAQSAIIRSQER